MEMPEMSRGLCLYRTVRSHTYYARLHA